MKFYYENFMGDTGTFKERNLIKAIYMAWNIEADLYLLIDNDWQIIFCPSETNDFNSDLLKEYGYKIIDGEKYREIVEIKTGKIIKYDWSKVKKLN